MNPQAEMLAVELHALIQKHIEAGMSHGDALGVFFGAAVGAAIANGVDKKQLYGTIDQLVSMSEREKTTAH